MKTFLLNQRGLTMLELMITSILLSLVIGVAASVYVSGARFLGNIRQSTVNFQSPNLNQITKRIDVANAANVSGGGSRLDVTCDCNMATLAPQNEIPYNPATDETATFMIVGDRVTMSLPGGGAPTTIFTGINSATSSFSMINPSNEGVATVVQMTLAFTSPPSTLTTRVSLGGATKR